MPRRFWTLEQKPREILRWAFGGLQNFHHERTGGVAVRWVLMCFVGGAVCSTAVQAQDKGKVGSESSETARTVDDEELARRLQAEAAGKGPENALARMLRYMTQSRDGLRDQFEAGEKTQTIQKKILVDLDEAIRFARNQMRKNSQKKGSSQGNDARRAGQPKKAGASRKQAGNKPSAKAAEDETATQGQARSGQLGGALRESGREWGHLPPRAREEVVQGFSEDVLLKYKAQIEKYYRALAEQNRRR